MTYDPERRQRRSLRLQGYDYSGEGAYFVTVCTHGRARPLGEVQDGTMVLSTNGRIVEECWLAVPRHFRGVELDEYVIMPNHFHAVVVIVQAQRGRGEAFAGRDRGVILDQPANASPQQLPHGTHSGSLSAIIQNFKSVSTRKINRLRSTPCAPVWQRNYYEHVIRHEDDLNEIRQYILNNPLQWEMDEDNPEVLARGRSGHTWHPPLENPSSLDDAGRKRNVAATGWSP